jgi:uncharacterized protein (TIGR02284 family)
MHGTASGAIHRGWIRVKDTLGATSDPDLLEDCEHFEGHALKRLQAAANDELLPGGVRDTLRRFAESAERGLERARHLREEQRATASLGRRGAPGRRASAAGG